MFTICGLAGFAFLVALAGLNALLFFLGYDNSAAQSFFQGMAPYVAFPAFISLFWLGMTPRAGTRAYVRGDYDHIWNPGGLHRWLFLITDDPRVIAKEAHRASKPSLGIAH